LSLASLGAAFGFRSCLRYLLGIIFGTIGVLLIVASGVTGLVSAAPLLVITLQFAAVAYIAWLAWKIMTAPVITETKRAGYVQEIIPASFLPGLGLAIANPKAFAAIGAVYAGHSVAPDTVILDTTLKITALAGVAILVNTAWLAFGTAFSRFLSHPVMGRAINIAFAALLLISISSLVIQSF
jgi:threonine/homoserine/homoserine lactone efflux protein